MLGIVPSDELSVSGVTLSAMHQQAARWYAELGSGSDPKHLRKMQIARVLKMFGAVVMSMLLHSPLSTQTPSRSTHIKASQKIA
jgi:hypothetical protein